MTQIELTPLQKEVINSMQEGYLLNGNECIPVNKNTIKSLYERQITKKIEAGILGLSSFGKSLKV